MLGAAGPGGGGQQEWVGGRAESRSKGSGQGYQRELWWDASQDRQTDTLLCPGTHSSKINQSIPSSKGPVSSREVLPLGGSWCGTRLWKDPPRRWGEQGWDAGGGGAWWPHEPPSVSPWVTRGSRSHVVQGYQWCLRRR